ncbi:zinc-binding alcohol dehydrogenase family protein [Opitutales bacterium ASA1]|uniref:zinc-binding alcohol dehydrogenase family protein n=1 Tax=Congregicoccus parvus TaxID=3081749 RepID=UPI002B2D8A63|nr:zinc-binding alcohol dehydrogenase family protein [Opitutales bacterium ASA1]
MNQIVLEAPGRFARAEVAEPTLGPGQALVRVHRIGICGTDLHAFHGRQPFFTYPRVLGHELGVEVLALGPGTEDTAIGIGDHCSVEPYLNCGHCIACRRGKPNCCTDLKVMGVHVDGGMRPLVALPARKLHPSSSLSFDQLALIETLGIGAHAVERAALRAEDTVLVIGAGPIGLSVIQFVLASGAALVVADVSETRLEFCRRQLGVTHTVAPGLDLPDRLRAIFGGDLPTAVIDATGNPKSMASSFDLPAHGGRIVFVGLFQGELAFNDPNFHRRELDLLASRNALPGTFRDIIAAVEAGRIDTSPWITHRLSLDEVPERFEALSADPALLKGMIAVA